MLYYSSFHQKEDNEISKISTHATEFQQMLQVGIDVDWLKTAEGRGAMRKARKAGINVPKKFKDRGFSHVRIRIKDDILTDPTLQDELLKTVIESLDAGLIPSAFSSSLPIKSPTLMNSTTWRSLHPVTISWRSGTSTQRDLKQTIPKNSGPSVRMRRKSSSPIVLITRLLGQMHTISRLG